MLLSKKHVAILGGSFNPVTKGHLEIAEHVLGSDICDEVWLMPCHSHPFDKELVSGAHRLNMCETACLPYDRITASDFEIRKKLDGKTLNLLHSLQDSEFSESTTFSFVIGLDNANIFSLWFKSDTLKNSVRFIVVPRCGQSETLADKWYRRPPHIFLDKPILQISSSEIRKVLKVYNKFGSFDKLPKDMQEKLEKGLPDGIFEYIAEHGLYKTGAVAL